MPKQKEVWDTITLSPLITPLDTRSRPADLLPGVMRWKQNLQVTPEGKLRRRPGFQVWHPNDGPFANGDFHFQNGTREPITFMFESTTGDGKRRFYCGTQSGIWLLDQATGTYTSILAGKGAEGTRWRAAELQDITVFTNNLDNVFYSNSGAAATELLGLKNDAGGNGVAVTAAAVVVSYNGFLIVMNLIKDGVRQSSTVHWSDLNLPLSWKPATDSLAGFQDLDYGDDILAAAPLLGGLYIFTRRAIWRMMPSGDAESIFAFTKVYSEPKNQTGCLAFPNTLVSDGQDLYYMGRDGIYRYNPYIPVPVRDDWLHRADGVMYVTTGKKLDTAYCLSPVAEYLPLSREIWFSWPDEAAKGINNWTLVAQTEHHTADVIDHGFTALCNFRLTPTSVQECNETQYFLGASGTDWTIKSIGEVFLRELYAVTLDENGLPTADLAESALPVSVGYYSILRGMVPLGMVDREKKVRKVLVDHDTSEADTYPVMQLRIGSAFSVVDSNSEATHCAPQWRVIKADGANGITNPELKCPDSRTVSEMASEGLRPNRGLSWPCMEVGRFLFFEFTVQNADASAAIGGDTALQRVDFDCLAMPKP